MWSEVLEVKDINVVLIGSHLKLEMFLSMGDQILFECYFKANFWQANLLNIMKNPKQPC